MSTPTPLDALRFFKEHHKEVLAVLRALDVRHAEELARALASLEDAGRLLQWLLGDRAQAPELWAELAPFRAALPKARKHPLGWVPAPADAKAPPWLPGSELWELRVPASASLVSAALRSGVRDQNPRGTCVAFATCKALEILHDDGVELSPQYLYYFMKQPERDRGTHSDGSHAAVSLDTVQDVGVCREAHMPYVAVDYAEEGEPVCGPPPSRAAELDAQARRTATNLLVARSDVQGLLDGVSSRGLMDWLRELVQPVPSASVRAQMTLLRFTQAALSGALGPAPRPVVGCFRWFASTQEMAGQSGRMGLPMPDEPRTGGHAMTVVGYAADPDYAGGGYLIVQNSWGDGWPRRSHEGRGLFRMCYAYAVAYMSEAGVPMREGEHARLAIPVAQRRGARATVAAEAEAAVGGGEAAVGGGEAAVGGAAVGGGAGVSATPRFCSQCGAATSPAGRFCTRCGAALVGGAAPTQLPPDPLAAHRARADDTLARHQARLQAVMERVGGGAAPTPRASGRCVFCGSSSYGSCSQSPFGRHKHEADGGHCAWCGSSSYGACSYAPQSKHEHGHGRGCRFCGSSSHGACSYAPSGRHEH